GGPCPCCRCSARCGRTAGSLRRISPPAPRRSFRNRLPSWNVFLDPLALTKPRTIGNRDGAGAQPPGSDCVHFATEALLRRAGGIGTCLLCGAVAYCCSAVSRLLSRSRRPPWAFPP